MLFIETETKWTLAVTMQPDSIETKKQPASYAQSIAGWKFKSADETVEKFLKSRVTGNIRHPQDTFAARPLG